MMTIPKIPTAAEMAASDIDMLRRAGFHEDFLGRGSYSFRDAIDPTLSAHVQKYGNVWGFTVWSEDVCVGARKPEWLVCDAAAKALEAMTEIVADRKPTPRGLFLCPRCGTRQWRVWPHPEGNLCNACQGELVPLEPID